MKRTGELEVVIAKGPAPAPARHYTDVGKEILPGDVLDDRFLITEEFRDGGMSKLFRAQDLEDDRRDVIVKIPNRGVESKPAMFSRFIREEEIGRRMKHPYILRFVPVDRPKSRPFIVSEYLRGSTLHDVLKARRRFSEADALKLGSQICEALEYVHGLGVTHRDLKPENVMICNDGTIRVMDFGVAKANESRRLTFFERPPGTPHYMAPEQASGRRGDSRSDIYSLGAILYQLLTGALPFDGEDLVDVMNVRVTADPPAPRSLNPDISPEAEEIVLRAMDRDPGLRYRDAAEMKRDLDAPMQVAVTGRAARLETPTPWKLTFQSVRPLIWWATLPVAAQVGLFFILWRHFAK